MLTISARNAQTMLPEAIRQLLLHGVPRESRNGPVLQFPCPVTLHYQRPLERVIFWPQRDANPFLHLFESLWMLAGRNDLAFLSRFTANMKQFSDDGRTLNGAYGFRWRQAFGYDQLGVVMAQLSKNRDDRRCYVQMWDARRDLGQKGKDFPCNLGITFQVNPVGVLDMVVHNRSNDLIWGALGANAVHMSFLQEYIAAGVGVPVGGYWQVSSNMHAYLKTLDPVRVLGDQAPDPYRFSSPWDPYQLRSDLVHPFPICVNGDLKTWGQDLEILLSEGPIVGFRHQFFRRVATPLLLAHKAYQDKSDPDRFFRVGDILEQCIATDWRRACMEWVGRRAEAVEEKNAA